MDKVGSNLINRIIFGFINVNRKSQIIWQSKLNLLRSFDLRFKKEAHDELFLMFLCRYCIERWHKTG
jgi:hypothetical protein